ncbi:MAG: hypothetical protein ACYSW6_04925 [Planctomycetota bacterium]|jgi:hypothetical protein
MEFLKKNPKSWKVLEKNDIVVSGYMGMGLYDWATRYDAAQYGEVDNFVFLARVKPIGVSKGYSSALTLFEDEDGVHRYEASTVAMYHILRAVVAGDVVTAGDYLRGAWTFRKMGKTVSLWPCDVLGKEYKNTK